jgi:hypothetical protein
MIFFGFIKRWKEKRRLKNLPMSQYLKIVKPGDVIHINDKRSEEVIKCYVENNDPDTQKIFLAVYYDKKEQVCKFKKVFPYSSICLRHFDVMNVSKAPEDKEIDTVEFLDGKLRLAISDEDYLLAAKLRNAIECLK